MMGRTRHHVHTSVHEDTDATLPEEPKDDKSGFFSRKLASLLRRASITTRVNDMNSVVPAMGNESPAQSPTQKQPIYVTDNEIVFGTKKHAVATSNGMRKANEDRFRVISDLELFGKGLITADRKTPTYQDVLDKQVLEAFARQGNAPRMDMKKLLKHKALTRTEFYGVFDGHGGAACSTILALLLPLYLLLSPDFHSNVIAAAKRACLTMNDEILKREAADECEGGSTALTVMIRNGVAFVCNIGDCRAIMISRRGVEPLTTDHKATNEKEKQRIEDAGGLVLYVKGVARVNGRLAVSRAFGDAELQQYVIANPEITCHQITPDDEYIVIGSDGLWDALSNEQVMACIRNHPWLSTDEIAQVLVNRAIEEGSMDNVTVMLIDVRKQ
jgi:protein phosphatase 1L